MSVLNTADTATAPKMPQVRSRSMRRVFRRPLAIVGSALIVCIAALAFLGPLFAPYSPTEFVDMPYTNARAGIWLGTDDLGRDVFSRVLHGGSSIVIMSTLAAVGGVLGGVIVGLVAGYASRLVDTVLMRSSDVILAFPPVILALIALSITGPQPWVIVTTVALSHIPTTARIVRAATSSVSNNAYVDAARVRGYSLWSIRMREILPNILSPLMVELGLKLTYSVAIVASLAFLGLGLQPPHADWGLMINENKSGMAVQPFGVLVPVLLVALLTVGFNLVTDAVSRTFDRSEVGAR